jgi:diguanylate cyclase (GGDEF)-like protein/PAS domain S-box-containing protein
MRETILLLQDNSAKAAIVQGLLARSSGTPFIVEWLRSCAAGLDRIKDSKKSGLAAILINLLLPDGRQLEVFNRIFDAAPHIPILILSSPEHEGVAEQAVRRGAKDYILDTQLFGNSLSKALRNMLERTVNAEVLFAGNERAQITLNSIGDGVISTDVDGKVTYLNQVAEAMTGWSSADARGRAYTEVFRVLDSTSLCYAVNPMATAMRQNSTVSLSDGCVLIRRDGREAHIEDSAAPIHDRKGQIIGAVMVFHDVTKVHAMTQHMSYLAHHDFLTDLPNRLLLNDRLAQAIAASRRQQQQLAVLFVDVDRFKHINDTLGHAIGDELLQSVAARLVAGVRASDTVSRQGGDEFVILLSGIALAEDAAVSAKKMLRSLSMPHRLGDHDLQVTISIGISVYPDDGDNAEMLVKNADVAMLTAKNNGRNNYQFFKSDMNVHALERQSLESGLRHALQGRQFLLHYQPKMDLETERITGVEALIRWQQPSGGIVLPDKFIPVAEQCGYIVPIGRWVLREACRQAKSWLDADLAPIPIAINVSAVELRSTGFVQGVRAVLQETGLDPQYLELELTETALMQDQNSTSGVLGALKDIGVQLTLDDFGTGYSSLSYLKRFPIDALKIDRSFVGGLCTNASDANIVSAVINMGKSFGLNVIAEGVETREQFMRLQAQQCAEGQGTYFNAPLAPDVLAALLGADSAITVRA